MYLYYSTHVDTYLKWIYFYKIVYLMRKLVVPYIVTLPMSVWTGKNKIYISISIFVPIVTINLYYPYIFKNAFSCFTEGQVCSCKVLNREKFVSPFPSPRILCFIHNILFYLCTKFYLNSIVLSSEVTNIRIKFRIHNNIM